MLKQNKNKIILSTLVLLIPVLVGLCLWNKLPDQIPTHWNFAGEIDGWSSKAFAIFGLSGILLAAHLLCVIGTSMDPKHQNIQGKMLNLVYWICPVLSVIVMTVMYSVAMGASISMNSMVFSLIGLLFVIMGNWLPKCQPNYTVGIRLPWTLYSEDNWRRTHRMAGPLWIIGGCFIIMGAFLGNAGAAILIAVLLVLILVPVLYSYLLYRKSQQ